MSGDPMRRLSMASAQEPPEDKRTLVLDINADGKPDRAPIVETDACDAP